MAVWILCLKRLWIFALAREHNSTCRAFFLVSLCLCLGVILNTSALVNITLDNGIKILKAERVKKV